jgi:hypothetical protein
MRTEEISEPIASKCEAYDRETGELPEPSKRRKRRVLAPEEQAVLDQRREDRAWMRRALEVLSPALVAEGDPPLRETGKLLTDVSRAREVELLLRVPQASGQGGPGSALTASMRDYDGGNGGDPQRYVLLNKEFHDGAGHKCRTRGVALRREAWRALAHVLNSCADEADAFDAANGAP